MISWDAMECDLEHFRLHFLNTPFLYKMTNRMTREMTNNEPRIIITK